MTARLHTLSLSGMPIYEQLQLEEALLRADTRNWCLINRGAPPAIVMGISGKPEQLIERDHYYSSPIPVIRRYSGGGTVVVDEETFFVSLICNADAFSSPLLYSREIFLWTEGLYTPVLGERFRLVESDYAIGERKCGGNAQHIARRRWVHHTTFLWGYSAQKMAYLSLPERQPSYREKRSHADFLCTLREELGVGMEQLESSLLKALSTHFDLENASFESASQLLSQPHRRATQRLSEI